MSDEASDMGSSSLPMFFTKPVVREIPIVCVQSMNSSVNRLSARPCSKAKLENVSTFLVLDENEDGYALEFSNGLRFHVVSNVAILPTEVKHDLLKPITRCHAVSLISGYLDVTRNSGNDVVHQGTSSTRFLVVLVAFKSSHDLFLSVFLQIVLVTTSKAKHSKGRQTMTGTL